MWPKWALTLSSRGCLHILFYFFLFILLLDLFFTKTLLSQLGICTLLLLHGEVTISAVYFKCSPGTLMDFGNKVQTGWSLADGGVSPRKTLYFICIKGSHRARRGPEIETRLFPPAAPSYSKQIHHFLCFLLGPITKKFGLKRSVLENRLLRPSETKHLDFCLLGKEENIFN